MPRRPLEIAHRVKELVLRSDTLRHVLRRLVVTPFQKREFRRLNDLLPDPAEEGGPTILVAAFRHWALSRAWELTLTRELQALGGRVVWVHCDRTMIRCDSMLNEELDRKLCRHCVSFNRDVANIAGIELLSLAEYLDRAPSPDEEVAERDTVQASLQRVLGSRTSQTPGPRERKIRREMEQSAAAVRRASRDLIAEVRPDVVLGLNGKFFAERILLEVAVEHDAAVWTYERGNRKNTIIAAPTPVAVPFYTGEVRDQLDEPLTPAQDHRLDDYLHRRATIGNGQISFAPKGSQHAVPETGGSRRLVSAFTNLIWDSAVAGEDTIFEDMFGWITTTVEVAARDPSVRLVIRVHPAESRVYWHPTREPVKEVMAHAFPDGLPANVELVGPDEPVNSYDLMRNSDLVLVYTSTVGLEAAVMGAPVIVAGRSNYSDTPFVTTPEDRAEYVQILETPGVVEWDDRRIPLARRFMYRLYFEQMVPMPYVVEDPTGFHIDSEQQEYGALGDLSEQIVTAARRGRMQSS